jgi:hypothetical protein
MMVAMADAAIWVAMAQPLPPPTTHVEPTANPYRDSAAPPEPVHQPELRLMGVLAAESLLYDSLLVAVVAAALLVSR